MPYAFDFVLFRGKELFLLAEQFSYFLWKSISKKWGNGMKRLFAVMLAVLLVLAASTVLASAAETADVYVTIADKAGKPVAAAEKVTVSDIDGDGALTINDALYAAHEQLYDGGAAAGYGTDMTQYGLSLVKLWGITDGYNFGYYVNNASAWSLTDTVSDGDYVVANAFTDTKNFSDKYAYFDKFREDVAAGEVTLTLNKADFDAEWNPITVPVEGAVITVDGTATEYKTDAEGKVVIKLEVNGEHVVSATAADQVLVPPVYVATVSGGVDPTEAETQAATQAATQSATTAPTQAATQATATTTSTSNNNAVKTGGENGLIYVAVCLTLLAFGAAVVLKKRDEK